MFIHLHCHSHFSFYNGTASPEALVRRASELNMSALALTDYCNLYGIPEFCRTAKEHGIKPIPGIEAVVAGYGLTLLAMNEEGWRNLMRLASLAICEGNGSRTPDIDKESLHKYNAGLICLSGFAGGEVGHILDEIGELLMSGEKRKPPLETEESSEITTGGISFHDQRVESADIHTTGEKRCNGVN